MKNIKTRADKHQKAAPGAGFLARILIAAILLMSAHSAYAARSGIVFEQLLAQTGETAAPQPEIPAAPALSRAGGLEGMNLQEVYSLPVPALEAALQDELAEECAMNFTPGGKPSPLTGIEQCAVSLYTSSWFYTINSKLWKTDQTGSALSGKEWAYVRVLDLALSKIPAKPALVYRGTARTIKFTAPGQVARLKGYSSTSPDMETAKWFLNSDAARLMIINSYSGRDIMPYTQTGQEKELLLPRSTWVRFDRAEMKRIKLLDEETGEEVTREVEFVYLTEVKAP
ncbi:MAG TPA: hypothetical protein DEQ38_02065 [Elusimicrobia bacterium]|nr:hypothetical protein [Elusimicrobiota bacterium]